MRCSLKLSVTCAMIGASVVGAQEQIPLPPPDPDQRVPVAAAPEMAPPPNLAGTYPTPLPMPSGANAPLPPYPPPGTYGPPNPPTVMVYPVGDPCFWLGAEGLVWWTQQQPLGVPLLTTGPASQGSNAGNLGAPGTVSLNSPLNLGAAAGLRLFAGGWFDAAHTIGMDGSLFFLQQQTASFGATDRSGTGQFVINEPVVGAPFSTQVSAPGIETGNATVNATTHFGGGDVNLLYNLFRGPSWTVNLLGGFRYLELDESLDIAATSSLFTTTTYSDNFGNVLATAPPGSSVTVFDHFGTRNQFYGGQVGARFQGTRGHWVFSGAGKVALGNVHEQVTINGNTNVFPVNGSPVSLAGGNFATLQSGCYAVNRFAVAPEFQASIGYQFTPCTRAMIGYNFLFLSNVVRPGNQIDNTYDGVVHPLVPMASSSFWAQGLTLSLQFNF